GPKLEAQRACRPGRRSGLTGWFANFFDPHYKLGHLVFYQRFTMRFDLLKFGNLPSHRRAFMARNCQGFHFCRQFFPRSTKRIDCELHMIKMGMSESGHGLPHLKATVGSFEPAFGVGSDLLRARKGLATNVSISPEYPSMRCGRAPASAQANR